MAVQLARYSIAEADYRLWHAARLREPAALPGRIDAVRATGTKLVNPEVIVVAIRTPAGEKLDTQVAAEAIKRICARGDFDRVNHSRVTDPVVGRVLIADVAEKSWGPNFVRVGLGLSSDLRGDSFFTLLATHRATWLNTLGGEWRNDGQIGHANRFATEFYQPLTSVQRFFAAAHAEPLKTRSTSTARPALGSRAAAVPPTVSASTRECLGSILRRRGSGCHEGASGSRPTPALCPVRY